MRAINVPPIKLLAYATLALLPVVANPPALAEIRLQGSAANLHLEAHDASVTEILAALAQRFDLRLRGAAPGRHVTATFRGPLRRVVMSVLDGSDYVIHSQGGAIDVLVTNGASSVAAVAPPRLFVAHPRAH
jgi:hypothetical protein